MDKDENKDIDTEWRTVSTLETGDLVFQGTLDKGKPKAVANVGSLSQQQLMFNVVQCSSFETPCLATLCEL